MHLRTGVSALRSVSFSSARVAFWPRGPLLFFAMTTESSTSTKGGSLGGFAGCCPACGYPDLEEISPERLYFLAQSESGCGMPLPDGRLPVHAQGKIWTMTAAEWSQYRSMCADGVTAQELRMPEGGR